MLKLSRVTIYWSFFEIYNNTEKEKMKPKGKGPH